MAVATWLVQNSQEVQGPEDSSHQSCRKSSSHSVDMGYGTTCHSSKAALLCCPMPWDAVPTLWNLRTSPGKASWCLSHVGYEETCSHDTLEIKFG